MVWQCELVTFFVVTPGLEAVRVLVLAEALLVQEETQLGVVEEVMVSFQVMDLRMKWMTNLKIRLTLQQGLMTLAVVPVPVPAQAHVQVLVQVWARALVLAEVIGVLPFDCQNRFLRDGVIASLSLLNSLSHARVPNIP